MLLCLCFVWLWILSHTWWSSRLTPALSSRIILRDLKGSYAVPGLNSGQDKCPIHWTFSLVLYSGMCELKKSLFCNVNVGNLFKYSSLINMTQRLRFKEILQICLHTCSRPENLALNSGRIYKEFSTCQKKRLYPVNVFYGPNWCYLL